MLTSSLRLKGGISLSETSETATVLTPIMSGNEPSGSLGTLVFEVGISSSTVELAISGYCELTKLQKDRENRKVISGNYTRMTG